MTVFPGEEVIASDINAPASAWATFTPSWVSSTNPAIGNGTILGRYKAIGKTTLFNIEITWGSTTTGGAGTWLVGLPVIPAIATSPGQAFSAHAIDASASTRYVLGCELDNANRVRLFNSGTANFATATVPMTWATSDILRISGTYESA